MHLRDIGYHAFNLQGFVLLHRAFPEHGFWQSKAMQRMLDYLSDQAFLLELARLDNVYGFPYNPAGFEAANALVQFGREGADRWVTEQFRRHWNKDSGLLNRNCADPNTLSARLYEVCSLPNMEIHLETDVSILTTSV